MPVSEMQKNYKTLVNKVNRIKKPIVLLCRNRPVGVVVDMGTFEAMRAAQRRWEEEDTRAAIVIAEKELKQGKIKVLKSSLISLLTKD